MTPLEIVLKNKYDPATKFIVEKWLIYFYTNTVRKLLWYFESNFVKFETILQKIDIFFQYLFS